MYLRSIAKQVAPIYMNLDRSFQMEYILRVERGLIS